jgi:dipeptidyl-peptidase-4
MAIHGAVADELTLDDLFASPKLTGTPPSQPSWSPDSKHIAFSWNKDGEPARGLWIASYDGKSVRPLATTKPGESVRAVAWLDDTIVLSLRGEHLWSSNVRSGRETRLAAVGSDAHDLKVSPDARQAAVLRSGDLWLVDLDTNAAKEATSLGIPGLSSLPSGRYSRAEREIGPGIWSGPTYAWSPDGRTIAIHVVDRREMRKVPFPNYLAKETDPNLVRRGYPGDPNEIRKVGLLDVDTGAIRFLDLPDPDANQVIDFSWSPDGELLVDVAADTAVDRRLYTVNVDTGEFSEVWHGHRASRMYTSFGSAWHPDGQRIVFLSDMNDRYGLFVIDPSDPDKEPELLTDPTFDVQSEPTLAGDAIFFAGNGVNPYERHVYKLELSAHHAERVTLLPGQNTGYPSPDGEHLAFVHSDDTTPQDLYVVNTTGGDARRVTHSPLAAFDEENWVKARYVSFPSQIDDYTLHARILEPADLEDGRKYPVLFGPVYSNTARNRWAGNYSLVQQLLVKKGYIVVQVDSRGSDGYGRAFREEFLLGFAGDDIEDYASAVKYMESLPYVDPDRIGIWGSSYGGTLAVYTLLKKPGLFKVGVAAAAAVDPDFFGTDDVAIVRRPETHPDVFENKAINWAGNLEDKLLFIHGMQDHVVPFKTTAALAEELIRQGKDFDFAFAPGATHSWSREPYYERYLFGKMIEYFDRHLGTGPE